MRPLTANENDPRMVMKRSKGFKKFTACSAGFSFIEIAIALIIIGVLTGAGFLLLGKTIDSTQRKETVQRLLDAKKALLLFAENKGRFPAFTETIVTPGYYDVTLDYYQQAGTSPVDVWKNSVKYIVSTNITATGQLDLCKKSKQPNGYTGWAGAGWLKLNDEVVGVNYLASGSVDRSKTIVALLYSGGARNVAEDNVGTALATTYLRKYPSETFDDIVVSITADEFYEAIEKHFCTVTVEITDIRDGNNLVKNPLGLGGVFYVYDKTAAPTKSIGSANAGAVSLEVLVPLGDEVLIKNAGGPLLLDPTPTIVTDTSADKTLLKPTMTVKIVDP